MEEEDEKRDVVFMGRSLSKIPCFRESFLYGISSGLGAGLLYFMMTSRVQRAAHLGMGTYGCVSLAYWIHCRYNYSIQKFNMSQLQEAMKKKNLYEGTALEKDMSEA